MLQQLLDFFRDIGSRRLSIRDSIHRDNLRGIVRANPALHRSAASSDNERASALRHRLPTP